MLTADVFASGMINVYSEVVQTFAIKILFYYKCVLIGE